MHVTVLIPVYNREQFIREAIDSVLAQDYDDWDILVVDDGSTDRTVELVKSKMVVDSRIQLVQMMHGGCAAATAMGIEHARGPVITSLDSDDRLMHDALSTVLPAFENNPRLGYVWTNWIWSTGEQGIGDFLPEGKLFFEAIMSGWFNCNCQRFFRKEIYLRSRGLDTSIKFAVDLQLVLLIGKTGCDTLHLPKVTYWRRKNPRSISAENYTEQQEATHLIRKNFMTMEFTKPYIAHLENEIDSLRSELEGIRGSFGYKYMKLYGTIIDRAFPENTRRGKLKRKIVNQIREL